MKTYAGALKRGEFILYQGNICQVMKTEFYSPGKGSALMHTKLETVVGRQVCSDGRMKDGDGGDCPDSRFEFLTSGTENVRTSTTTREQIWVNRDTDKQAKEGEGGAELREKNVMKDKFSTYCLDCAH
jgi:hypothetical protein